MYNTNEFISGNGVKLDISNLSNYVEKEKRIYKLLI